LGLAIKTRKVRENREIATKRVNVKKPSSYPAVNFWKILEDKFLNTKSAVKKLRKEGL
jgi:hypothetical protein